MMNNLKAVLFDLDGTLVDTSRDITANLNRAFVSMNYPKLSHETILSHVGFGAHFLVEKCLHENQPDIVVDEKLVTEVWERFRDFYRVHIVDEASPYPGVREFLESENRPMGVISNKPEEFVQAVLRELGLIHHFNFAWGRDTLPVSKPNPEVIRYGVHELKIEDPKLVCMVGDNPVDIIAAKGAGTISVALSQGFSPRKLLEEETPDFLFKTFQQFAEMAKGE
ncbi:MAG: HAD-IA family hydrolase [Candidatus Marinimicrobia bacterium]|nr:HAD-IA family hydrolase [Candidatus Neomarinimicrobiota bacterium]